MTTALTYVKVRSLRCSKSRELQAQLDEDNAAIQAQTDQVARLQSEIGRAKAQHDMLHLQYDRLAGVAKSQAGLVAQQEVDDAHGKDLAAESQVEAAQGAYQAAQSQLMAAKAKLSHDQALVDVSAEPTWVGPFLNNPFQTVRAVFPHTA